MSIRQFISEPMSKPAELIDEMIARTPDWRGPAFAELRKIIHDADPQIIEEVKWKKPSNPFGAPVFEHAGIVCIGGFLKGGPALERRQPSPGVALGQGGHR